MRAGITARDRRLQSLRRQLDLYRLGQRLAAIRTRLVAGDGRLAAAIVRSHHRADARLRGCASRLQSLSPLAVLARGYAVCWNADGTRILRDAADAAAGDPVRITLAKGELECEVRSISDARRQTPETRRNNTT
jgi:exodeoxyribonuclease VII large subunit